MSINWKMTRTIIIATLLVSLVASLFIWAALIDAENKKINGCVSGAECSCKNHCKKINAEEHIFIEGIFSDSCSCIKNGEIVKLN